MNEATSGIAALDRYQLDMEAQRGEVEFRHLGPIDARTIRRYALTVGETNAIHYDHKAARAAGYGDIVAPPNMLSAIHEWDTGPAESALQPDGTHRVADTETLRVMGAGERLELLVPVIAGMMIMERRSIEAVERKEGKSGPLLFVTTMIEFSDHEGRVLNRNRRTLVALS